MKSTLFDRLKLEAKSSYTLYELEASIENNINNIIQEKDQGFEKNLIFESIAELQEYYKKKF